MKSVSRGFRLLLSALLCAFLLFGFLRFASHMLRAERRDRTAVEAYFQDVDGRSEYVNLYGAVQCLLGKRQIENFTIFKNDYDKLVAPRPGLDIVDIEQKAFGGQANLGAFTGIECAIFVYRRAAADCGRSGSARRHCGSHPSECSVAS